MDEALALLAVSAIRQYRKEHNLNAGLPINERAKTAIPNQAYIINSLKHPKEAEKLREIYGENFILISLFSPKERREDSLTERIKTSHHPAVNSEKYRASAKELIKKDENQEDVGYGQNVREVFPLADFFIKDESDDKSLMCQIQRFVQILFNYPYATPTVDEYCMFTASAAALRSADLSRQVGAIIASSDGEVLTSGCNEVPKAGGGAFWEGTDSPDYDYRDFRLKSDANAILKAKNVTEFFDILKKNGLIAKEYRKNSPEELTQKALFDKQGYLKNSAIANIIEYGRIVHAEMTAIIEAARRGVSIKNQILYCTTFPCHMCARHILASGIKKVIYIEPYPKSLTKELYNRAVKVDDGKQCDQEAVEFEPFVGIAPRKYFALFQMTKRKNPKGYTLDWKAEDSVPKIRNPHEKRYILAETVAINSISHIIEKSQRGKKYAKRSK